MTRPTGKRKRRTIVEEEIPEGEVLDGQEPVNEFDLALEQVQDLEAMNAILEQYGVQENGQNFKVFKVVDGVQRYVFEQATLDEAFIQRERGGGNYIARFFHNGKYKKSIPVFIEDLPESAHKENGNGTGHQAFLEKLLMALILKENNNSGSAPSLTDLTAALANMDQLRGKQENAIDTLIKGIEMGKSLDGGGGSLDWKTELLRLAKDNLPGVVGVIQQGIAAKNGGPAPPVQNPVPGPGNPVQVVQSEEQQMALMLKHAIGVLKSQFMMGLDSESAIALIMANVANPQYHGIIQQFVIMSFDELVALDADIGKEPFNTRFRVVHDGLRSAFSETDPMDDDSSGRSGNVVNLGRDGKSG